ncbi:MAG: 50S ribosomal protein L6 [Patescibacteria group bacterium]
MSRIGKKIVPILPGVTVDLKENQVVVKGPKGELTLELNPRVRVEIQTIEGTDALVVTPVDIAEDKAIWGTMRSHLMNMVQGVTEGWLKALELNGVGFKMNLSGKILKLSLGFSHDIDYNIPEGIEVSIENNILSIRGADRQMVGQVAAEIRALKKPEPYKGKGFRYTDEVIRRKVGKAAKSD